MEQVVGNRVDRGRPAAKVRKALCAVLLAAGMCIGLNSCWFNTAGYIFDTASYDAKATSADIAKGDKVYDKDGTYYVYLPTYKTGKGPKLVYGIGAQDNRKERCDKDGHAYFRIPAPYAMYLTGRSDDAVKPELVRDDSFSGGSCMTWPVVRTSEEKSECRFTDSCTGSSLLQLFGFVDLVCVDVPVSVASTGVATVGSVFGGVYSIVKYATKSSETAASAADKTASATPAAPEAPSPDSSAAEPASQQTIAPGDDGGLDPTVMNPGVNLCWRCKGTGRLLYATRANPSGGPVKKLYISCPKCQGKGVTFGF